jgi:hypothetical protein
MLDRPDADIFCVVCDESCISSEEKAIDRSRLSLQLQEIIKLAKSKVSKYDSKIHYSLLKVMKHRSDAGDCPHLLCPML